MGCGPAGMALTLELVKKLVSLNAPILYLHHRDNYMPCSVEYFMAHSELCSLTLVRPAAASLACCPSI